MDIIFCLSYLNVPDTISIIEKNKTNFKIATSNNNIRKLFKELYSEENIWYIEKPKFSKKHLLRSLRNIKTAQKSILNKIYSYKDNQIYAFFISYCFFEAWIVKKLSESNKVFYKPAVEVETIESYNWKGLLKKYLIKLIYGVDVSLNYYGGRYRPIISDTYLQKIDSRKLFLEDSVNVAQNVITQNFQVAKADILLLVGSIVEMDFVAMNSYCTEMDKLIECLREKGFTISVKVHPRFNKLYSKEKELDQIPNYIPASLILDNFNYVMGFATSTLFEAADQGKKSISLLKYFTPKSQEKVEDAYSYLIDNNNSESSILFPQNITQVLEVLSSK